MPIDPAPLGFRFAEILNSRDLDRFAELVAPDYLNQNPYAAPGLAGVKGVFAAILAGVPDLHVTAEDVFASGDGTRVVGRYSYAGTRTGDLLGHPGTGNRFAMRSIDIWRVRDGRFVEHWDELNTLDLFEGLGAVRWLAPARAS